MIQVIIYSQIIRMSRKSRLDVNHGSSPHDSAFNLQIKSCNCYFVLNVFQKIPKVPKAKKVKDPSEKKERKKSTDKEKKPRKSSR